MISENPGHKVLSSLVAAPGAAMSRPQDAPPATTTMNNAMSTVANAISIPGSLHNNEKSEISPASITSLGSLGSTAQTATASTTAAASPSTTLGATEKDIRDPRTLLSADPPPALEDKPSPRALSYPGNVIREQESSRATPNAATRGQSLPGSGLNQPHAPSRSYSHKKHKCPYCETEFTRHHNLKSHLLTHSQEKPYVCSTCQMRFRRLHDLKRHTKLHTGERPHICPKCNRKFARGDALARHSKGHGGCAGRRASQGSFGGDEDFDDSHMGEGDDSGMDGIIYAEPAEHNEGESDDERRFSLPSIKAQHVGSGHGAQEVFTPHARTPSTYPPAGPRQQRQRNAAPYPPHTADRGGSGSSIGTSASNQNSMVGGHSANISLPTAAGPGGTSMFSQTGMTESPKPLSPGTTHHQRGSLDAGSMGRQRSPSLTTQLQQAHFGRMQPDRSTSQGMTLPAPHGSKLPALSGLAPPDARYTLPSQAPTAQQAATNGNQGSQQGQPANFGNQGNPAFQPQMTAAGQGVGAVSGTPLHQGSGSGDSSNNLFASGDRGVWTYVQSLEDKVKHLSERVALMENNERIQEDRIFQLSNELNALRSQLNNRQLMHSAQSTQPPSAPNIGHMNR